MSAYLLRHVLRTRYSFCWCSACLRCNVPALSLGRLWSSWQRSCANGPCLLLMQVWKAWPFRVRCMRTLSAEFPEASRAVRSLVH
eukprot:g12100.t1